MGHKCAIYMMKSHIKALFFITRSVSLRANVFKTGVENESGIDVGFAWGAPLHWKQP